MTVIRDIREGGGGLVGMQAGANGVGLRFRRLEEPFDVKCPHCDAALYRYDAAGPLEMLVEGHAYTDGDTVINRLVDFDRIEEYRTEALTSTDRQLLFGTCPRCLGHYYTINVAVTNRLFGTDEDAALTRLVEQTVDDPANHANNFFCRAEDSAGKAGATALPHLPPAWVVNSGVLDGARVVQHDIGPFPLDQDIRGEAGVSVCSANTEEHWRHAARVFEAVVGASFEFVRNGGELIGTPPAAETEGGTVRVKDLPYPAVALVWAVAAATFWLALRVGGLAPSAFTAGFVGAVATATFLQFFIIWRTAGASRKVFYLSAALITFMLAGCASALYVNAAHEGAIKVLLRGIAEGEASHRTYPTSANK